MNKSLSLGGFCVKIYDTRAEMGFCAAIDIANGIAEVLASKQECNMIFAAAPSQNDMLSALIALPNIEWNRINAFHMDEYIGLSPAAPQAFGNFLREAIFSRVAFNSVNYINASALKVQEECARYTALLQKEKVDIVCMGIGENGHIAFNDPPVADFNDKLLIKPVDLDEICRQQQVNDKCFANISQVPKTALTLTIPALLQADKIYCVVPSSTKAQAVKATVIGAIETACPASILREHHNAVLYLDAESSALL